MAVNANRVERPELVWRRSSTTPAPVQGIDFWDNNTLRSHQDPFVAVKSVTGWWTPEPEGVKTLYYSTTDVIFIGPTSELHFGAMGSPLPSDLMSAFVLEGCTIQETDESTGAGEFNCLLTLGSSPDRFIEVKHHRNQPDKAFSGVPLSSTSDFLAIRLALHRVRTTTRPPGQRIE